MRFDRARGQAVGDHDRAVVAAARVRREPRVGVAGKAAAEIGTHEIARPVGGGARDREYGEAKRRKLGDAARLVELRRGRERGAGARQRDARGGQRAQLRPRLILRRRRRVCGRAVFGHGLG